MADSLDRLNVPPKLAFTFHWRPPMQQSLHVRQFLEDIAAVVDRTPGSSRKFMTPMAVQTPSFGQKKSQRRRPSGNRNGARQREIDVCYLLFSKALVRFSQQVAKVMSI